MVGISCRDSFPAVLVGCSLSATEFDCCSGSGAPFCVAAILYCIAKWHKEPRQTNGETTAAEIQAKVRRVSML